MQSFHAANDYLICDIFFIVSANLVEVQEVVDIVINRIQDLGLIDETDSADVVESPSEIQVPVAGAGTDSRSAGLR